MPNYIIAYHGGKKPASPEEGKQHMTKWNAWASGLGEAAITPGTPLRNSKVVSSEGAVSDGGSDAMSGFTIVKADTFDDALEMAKACPHLDLGCALEVAELMEMPG